MPRPCWSSRACSGLMGELCWSFECLKYCWPKDIWDTRATSDKGVTEALHVVGLSQWIERQAPQSANVLRAKVNKGTSGPTLYAG